MTTDNTLYTGHDFLTLPEVMECVEWVCTDTAQWLRSQYRYGEAARILAQSSAIGINL